MPRTRRNLRLCRTGKEWQRVGRDAGSAAGRVVVAAALAQRPNRGGHAWVVLSYLLGFRRLGWSVTLVDRLPLAACVDRTGAPVAPEHSVGYAYARAALDRFGLADCYCLLVDGRAEP